MTAWIVHGLPVGSRKRPGELVEDGMTMIVVTREMGFARAAADRLVMFDQGVILEEGSPEQLMTDPGHERTRTFLRRIIEHV